MNTLMYTGERAVPWNGATGKDVMVPHIMRYAWATQFCWQKDVVDIACGSGYGSFMLSMVARSVLGFDIDHDAINFARRQFRTDNLDYEVRNMLGGIPGGEVYVAFECLEHIDNPRQVLEHLDGKTLVWSIPVNNNTRYHKRGYGIEDIEHLMNGSEFWYQDKFGIHAAGDWAVLRFPPCEYVLGVLR